MSEHSDFSANRRHFSRLRTLIEAGGVARNICNRAARLRPFVTGGQIRFFSKLFVFMLLNTAFSTTALINKELASSISDAPQTIRVQISAIGSELVLRIFQIAVGYSVPPRKLCGRSSIQV